MSIFGFLGGIFKPAADLVDSLHTSAEEKLQAKAILRKLENDVTLQVIGYEKQLIESQQAIIVAETKSDSWITRSWRPLVMLMFAGIVGWGYVSGNTPDPAIMLSINIGLGGYIGGRSAEKIIPGVVNALKSKEEV